MKSILITGASSGIGRATAEVFLQAGWQVGLVARRAEALEDLAQGRENAVVLPGDVTDAKRMEVVFQSFVDHCGRLDVLFNNAGMFGASGPIDEIPLESFDEVMNVNIRGMFICARQAFYHMRRQTPRGGRIINNGSLSAHNPRPGSVSYTTSKHAITGLTRTLSLDGRAFDIACGQIDIGRAYFCVGTDRCRCCAASVRRRNPKWLPARFFVPPGAPCEAGALSALHV